MQTTMNLKIKYRESFRPFAPSVLEEEREEWFDLPCESPYMLLVAPVASARRLDDPLEASALSGLDRLKARRSEIPAVTHVDGSARVQTVDAERNPLYYDLLRAFARRTGCPVLINTSFNVRGEPIVCSPEEALRCFLATEMDALVMGQQIVLKEEQSEATAPARDEHLARFALD